jgi:class 3 adenylate cyclase
VASATRLAIENSQLQAALVLHRDLPHGLAERVMERGGSIGETSRVTISVLMSDVRGFVTIAETADPEALAGQLNEHRAAMTRVVTAHGGTLMQFVGDAVFAVFGAPDPMDDHAPRAVATATEMHRRQATLNDGWVAAGLPRFDLGIAVTTGEVAAALLGSDEHVEYSVVGDAVNLAQRIQVLAAAGDVVIDDQTARRLHRAAELIPNPLTSVKGRVAPVSTYRVGPASVGEIPAVPAADPAGQLS